MPPFHFLSLPPKLGRVEYRSQKAKERKKSHRVSLFAMRERHCPGCCTGPADWGDRYANRCFRNDDAAAGW